MAISVFFSFIIYQGATAELRRIETAQRLRLHGPGFFVIEPEIINESKRRILFTLTGVNTFILALSAIAGYYLAGKTLKPIAKMVEKQKDFIANASHELKTPLTAMKSEIEVILRNKDLSLKDAKYQLLSNLEEVDKMTSLTNYLLKLNKFQDNTKIVFRKFNLKDALKDAVGKIKPLAEVKNIKLTEKFQDKYLKGDRQLITEVVVILLDNAIKYSSDSSEVIIKTTKKGFLVSDFGVGIDTSDSAFIFDKFYRGESSRTKNKNDGFGLGLSIAKNIVDIHKGKIEVKSKLGKGSIFKVTFS